MKTPVVITFAASSTERHLPILQRLGAKVILAETFAEAQKQYHLATHILLQGGTDIHPAMYNAHRMKYCWEHNRERDAIEYALANSAKRDRKPILGICRGHQMAGIVWGAILYQDLEIEAETFHPNNHVITLQDDSRLRKQFPYKTIVVNSLHHQAIVQTPKGLKTAARASDGIVEAMEGERVLAVQWHPELLGDRHADAVYGLWLRMPSRGAE